jgi:hypothetical protein
LDIGGSYRGLLDIDRYNEADFTRHSIILITGFSLPKTPAMENSSSLEPKLIPPMR